MVLDGVFARVGGWLEFKLAEVHEARHRAVEEVAERYGFRFLLLFGTAFDPNSEHTLPSVIYHGCKSWMI